jgi:hypothetical protein
MKLLESFLKLGGTLYYERYEGMSPANNPSMFRLNYGDFTVTAPTVDEGLQTMFQLILKHTRRVVN